MIAPQRSEGRSATPDQTRMRIFAATRQLISKKGRRGTTTREIAERAGVNEATLFRHFGNKDALIEACARHYCTGFDLEEIVNGLSGDLEKDLLVIARALTERMETLRDLIVMSLAEAEDEDQVRPVDNLAWSTPAAIHRILVDFMARRIQSGDLHGDPAMLARFFMGMIFAHVIGRKKFPGPALSSGAWTQFQIQTFLHGVKKEEHGIG